MRVPARVSTAMTVLAGLDAVVGSWALLAPRAFYDHFPGGPFRWISTLGPYSAHLVTDVGGGYLMMTVLLALAARVGERRVVQVALVAVLVQAVPHLTWHLLHLHGLGVGNAATLIVVLVGVTLVPAVLLAMVREPART